MAVGEAIDRLAHRARRQPHPLGSLGVGFEVHHLALKQQRAGLAVLGLVVAPGEWAAARAIAHQRQFGLGQQLQQIGPRRDQPDLDHPAGHRHHIIDRAERVGQRVEAGPGDLLFEQPGDVAGADRATVRPVAALQPEDIAQPVVADVPAFGEARFDLAARVEPHQPLRHRIAQHGVGGGQLPRRVAKARGGTNHRHPDRRIA